MEILCVAKANLPITQAFLFEESSTHVGALLQMLETRSDDPLKDLTRLVRGGPQREEADLIHSPFETNLAFCEWETSLFE